MESAARQAEILSTLPRVQNCHMTDWDSQVQSLIDNVFTGESQAAGKSPETRQYRAKVPFRLISLTVAIENLV